MYALDFKKANELLERIAKALEQIAENTKSDEVRERQYRIEGFNAGEKK